MSDEWVRIQTTKIKISPDLYVKGLKTTFLSALRDLLCGKGILLSELMNRIEYVYKKGPLSKPSLFDTVEGIDSSEHAETIRRKRLEDQHASCRATVVVSIQPCCIPYGSGERRGRSDMESIP